MEHELGAGLLEQAHHVGVLGQVVVAPPRHERVEPARAQPLDDVGAEEAPAAGDQGPHRAGCGVPVGSQSTRPIQRSRFSAYQAIVRATPSSHEIFGSQPVSRLSFS